MPIEVQTSLMTGGLDLASPPIAVPPGKVIAASNYEPDISGYTSMAGYERFDGHERPSDSDVPATVAARRSVIQPVPGVGPVRGVWVYDGAVYAFRDQEDGFAGMYKSTSGGWQVQAYGTSLYFAAGITEFIEGQYVIGVSSGASALILRVALRNGAWDGTAEGYLIVTEITGAFEEEEDITTTTGEATALSTVSLSIRGGGRYDFTNHNFYGAASRSRMYFCNGVDTAFEWDGSTLASINTGTSGGILTGISYLLMPPAPVAAGEFLMAADHVSPIILSATFDAPTYIAHFKNHLFLGYATGSLINSSLGEPLQFITTTGAGEISFGDQITGLLTAASTSLVVFGQNRIEYVTGTDAATFTMQPLSDASGAQAYTVQMMDTPMFLDDGGIRTLSTTAAFGDWRMATVTQAVERLLRQKREQGVSAIASMQIKAKDQYRLFWNDGSGITVYIGREHPETMPFYLDQDVFCTCQGELEQGFGSRLFIGCYNGYVYEMNRGTSFDGNAIDSYIRLPFTAAKSPQQNTRWMKVSFEIDTPDDLDIGVAFDIDYARGSGGVQSVVDVDAGSPIVTTEQYDNVDWTQPVQGRLEYHLSGIGPNISATLITSTALCRPHTISSQTYNFSRRGLKR